MEIIVDDLNGPEIIELLEEHMRHMIAVTPPGCVYALDIEALKEPEITFWSVRQGDAVVGCGALKKLDAQHAEIKSMRTASSHQRQGVASFLLTFILEQARNSRYHRVSLETGSQEALLPARRLYEKFGFSYCAPFSDYEDNGNSVFMTLAL